MNGKLVVIINGKGGSGKDTMVEEALKEIDGVNVSSITPIKEIARLGGYAGSKDDKDRKFLSDLKALFTEYNELPTRYLLGEYKKFVSNSCLDVCFMHIREPKEIEKMVNALNGECKTILVKGRVDEKSFGNSSDDDVECYDYDYTFFNTKSIKESGKEFTALIKRLVKEAGESGKIMPHGGNPFLG